MVGLDHVTCNEMRSHVWLAMNPPLFFLTSHTVEFAENIVGNTTSASTAHSTGTIIQHG